MSVKVLYEVDRGLYQVADANGTGGLYLSGSVQIQSISYNNKTINSTYTLSSSESIVFVDCSGGDVSVYLPSARISRGNVYQLKKIDSTGFYMILHGVGGETIDGSPNKQINTQYTTITVTSNGSEWFIL